MGTPTDEHDDPAGDVDDVPSAARGGESTLTVNDSRTTWLAATSLLAAAAFAMALVALVVAFTIDGGGGGGGDRETLVPTADLRVEGREYSFIPARAAVPADTDVTLTFDNTGSLEHNWVVLSSRISSESEFDESLVLAGSAIIAGGSSDTTTFNLPRGEYQVICTIAGHFASGMAGSLTVG